MSIVSKLIDKFRYKETTETFIEGGWTHRISKTHSFLFGTYIHEMHKSNENSCISYYEVYKLYRNGKRKLIYSSTGL